MSVIAIIQAHMGSTRLPGKVLLDLEGKPVLERVIRRVQACKRVDETVVATSDLPCDQVLEDFCRKLHVRFHRGSDDDVLERFAETAKAYPAKYYVRITSDCPLIDPSVSDAIISRFLEARPNADYASNKIPQSFPRGLDTEIFTAEALKKAESEATEKHQRIHVTPYFYEHPELFRLMSIESEVDRADWRWTLDTKEDLEFIRKVYAYFKGRDNFSWIDVLDLLHKEPELKAINGHIVQKSLHEG